MNPWAAVADRLTAWLDKWLPLALARKSGKDAVKSDLEKEQLRNEIERRDAVDAAREATADRTHDERVDRVRKWRRRQG